MTAFVRQGDPRWAAQRLGLGKSTFHGAGCVLCCITEAARQLGTVNHADPRIVADAGVAAGAFVGSNAVIDKLAECVGLKAGPKVALSVDVMSKMVSSYLGSGRLVLLHVDHDSELADGDFDGDHFILALRQTPAGFLCADPATGEACHIAVSNLSGPAAWGRQRSFTVRGFRTLSKLHESPPASI